MKAVMAAIAMCLLFAAPGAANDAVDFAKAVGEFAVDTLTDAQGVGLQRLNGDVGDATALYLDREWTVGETLTLRGLLGVTTSIGGEPQNQLTAGVSVSLANWKGTRLVVGVNLTSHDVAERRVPLLEHVGLCVRYVPTIAVVRSL